jgi:hypothetical protein
LKKKRRKKKSFMLENTAIGITGAEVFLNIWKNIDLLVAMSGGMVFSEKKWIQDVSTSTEFLLMTSTYQQSQA